MKTRIFKIGFFILLATIFFLLWQLNSAKVELRDLNGKTIDIIDDKLEIETELAEFKIRFKDLEFRYDSLLASQSEN